MAHDRRFRFGVQLSFAGTGEQWAAKARRVEALGYSTLCMPDHFDDQLAPLPALLAAAAATSTLRVGTLVLDNDYRHPLITAKEAATVDLLSGGRFELGLGAGWLRSDYEQSGIPCDPPAVRIDRLAEGVAVVKGLLAGGKFSFAGRHYTVTGHPGTPLPAQRPRPPILIGGGGRRILSLAGREADIVSVNFDLSSGSIGTQVGATATAGATAEKVGWVREAAGDRFDDLELSYTAYLTMVTDDRETVAAGLGVGFGLDGEQVLAMPNFAIGTATQIADELERRRDELGLSYVVVGGECHEAMAPVVERLAGR
ncbi:MAG TPA: TIGR03621 family F420-dependent LLM class oxidoreductase [Acidimicrobiales bacterium]|nr:TIGR03621 family F420-dependent LLM class oxidoreductase [Acidimicrobiales bacterium]